jgi:nitrogen PTS system EIIA component
MGSLADFLTPDCLLELKSVEKEAALKEMVHSIAALPGQPGARRLLQAILSREELRPTGIGEGIAIPHCKNERISSFGVAIGRVGTPIQFGSTDGKPVSLLAMICAPEERQTEYLRLLSKVTRFLKRERTRLLEARTIRSIYSVLTEY